MSQSQPNILLIMADQLAAPVLPVYGHKLVQAPHLLELASRSVVFDAAYCNSPICASSRFSMLSGRLPTAIDAFDNGAEFYASIPTLAHYLTGLGYETTLCGKMHFVGPDQLHGYEERLITDIYPSDFSWTPDWRDGPTSVPSGVSVRVIQESGHCERSLQIDYDDVVEFHAIQKIYDLARRPVEKPFFLTVSLTHPHHPFTAPKDYWDRYRHEDIDMPIVPALPLEELDTHSRWLYYSHRRDKYEITAEHVRNARHAYYGMVTYVDDKVGSILKALQRAKLDKNTIVIFTADHGEMIGERGMWFKQSFFEWSVRVPLLISYPAAYAPRREKKAVSLVDLAPTLVEMASAGVAVSPIDRFDGHSLNGLLKGQDDEWSDTVFSEYTDMGVTAPCRMVRSGRFKYMYTHGHEGQLYDIESDPHELKNLAGLLEHSSVERAMRERILKNWDPVTVNDRVLASQQRRRFISGVAQKSGKYSNWAYVSRTGDERRFVRGAGSAAGVAGAKRLARFPFVEMPD